MTGKEAQGSARSGYAVGRVTDSIQERVTISKAQYDGAIEAKPRLLEARLIEERLDRSS